MTGRRGGRLPELPSVLAARAPRVVVVGDAILDVWLHGDADRLCREAPAPVVSVRHRTASPGGAANTAVNLAALGADTTLVTPIGDDAAGAELRGLLTAAGVRVRGCARGARTVVKHRVLADDHLMVRYDEGEAERWACPPVAVTDALVGADALVVCDYGLGACDDLVDRLPTWRTSLPLLVVDAHDPARWRGARADVVTPNAGEVARLLGTDLPADRVAHLTARGGDVLAAAGAGAVVATLDREGALVLTPGARPHRTWADPAPETQASGAGDTFCAALTAALACDVPLPLAAELAQAAADVVVHRPGTSVCGTAELVAALGGNRAVPLEALVPVVARARAGGARVVLTNGCFDVLHRGHIACLTEARAMGDLLVVGVNDDASVRALKGGGRPVNPLADRVAVLSALSCVDHLVAFSGTDARALVSALRPDVYAKGGDHSAADLPEAAAVRAAGGQVRIVNRLADVSTSVVLDRITAAHPA
ncbi:PfkB family carbohydrate kinase [Actinokineospora bangkokensis]|uniref:D-glycero-beta-D-manno-heptose 1-phosphate adenylyltransferase n=1 Tax=Actinokineospora bangkokensis TaxID=1193682 RepID=A0A1Q9LLN7_9PSEU|nr:PfkB family carbohydrate kinase [Actinokineospora bangkokensis]OLR92948.1 hypothetical protein BJP25_18425 [Actinokineospora bangkokensis]